ncbi:B-cell CLL/lymphoma 6 member B protein [Paramisgurnus dabryanus]|uniref:B-cell CLL/lymphoma 6 member B protein n=1 Tax=Paramisgurnus dabryanus TaxID=90735 RepID=UPI0031F3CBD1
MKMEEHHLKPSQHAAATNVIEMEGYVKEFTRHSNDVLLNLNELRHRDILTDATLLVGTTKLRAHCAVLIACSGFFYTLFSRRANGACGDRGLSLTLPEGLDAGSVSMLLDFMYTSRLPLTPGTVSGVLVAATYLQMEHVADTCRTFIQHSGRVSMNPCLMETTSRAPLGGRSPPAHPIIFSSPSRPTNEAEDPIPDRARVPEESISVDSGTTMTAVPTSQTLKIEELDSLPSSPSTLFPDSPSHSTGHPNSPAESSNCNLSPQLKKRTESKPTPDPKACNWKKYKYIVLNPLCATPIKEEEAHGEGHQAQNHSHFESDKMKASSETVNEVWGGNESGLNNRKSPTVPKIFFTPHKVVEHSFQPLTLSMTEEKGLCSPYVCTPGLGQSISQSHFLGQHPIKIEKFSTPYSGNQRNTKQSCTDKPYRCNVCGAQFNRPANLKTHSRIHSGEKPYRCDTCGARFVQVAHLRAHVLIHTGEKPYPCNTCGTRFRHLQTLKSHLRIHTGEKPYSCEKCHLHFRHKSQLRLHLRQKHGAITNTKIRYKVLADPYQHGPTLLQAC